MAIINGEFKQTGIERKMFREELKERGYIDMFLVSESELRNKMTAFKNAKSKMNNIVWELIMELIEENKELRRENDKLREHN